MYIVQGFYLRDSRIDPEESSLVRRIMVPGEGVEVGGTVNIDSIRQQ